MNSNIGAVSNVPLCNPADREKLSPLAWLLIALVFAVAILLRQIVPLNTDVSWLLTIGERVLDGQRLYVDIVEINPPMAVFAYLPGVALARALGVDPKNVTDALILILAASSLLATARILRLSLLLSHVRLASLAIWAAAVVTVLPMQVFGQREHIATLTFLPALAVYALRGNREQPPLWSILMAGIGAGITLAFKPFFLVPVVLCILLTVIRSRSWQVLLSPEMQVSTVLFNSATALSAIAMIAILRARKERNWDSAVLFAALASLGFAISFFLQRRGWAYHSYPMVALALLAMGYALTADSDAKSNPRRPSIAAIAVLIATFALGSLWFDTSVYVGPIEGAVAALKARPKILVLSGEAAIGHPMVRTLHGVWVSRQENLWIREFVRLTREKTIVDAPTNAKLDGYLAQERSWLIEDFKRLPPDIVLVDNLRDGWGAWARADSEVAELLKPYALVQSIDGIDILRRAD
jgi:hypothetical protein